MRLWNHSGKNPYNMGVGHGLGEAVDIPVQRCLSSLSSRVKPHNHTTLHRIIPLPSLTDVASQVVVVVLIVNFDHTTYACIAIGFQVPPTHLGRFRPSS